jgi:NDP-sugar pyrophosphorylase family protein
MQAVILAGGKGTRLLPFTKVFPKPLVPLGEKPILDTILRQLKHFGFTRVTLAVGHKADMIQTYVRNGEQYGIEIDYTFEEEPLGTVGPLAQIKDVEQSFSMNGDLITNLDYSDLVASISSKLLPLSAHIRRIKDRLGIIQNGDGYSIIDYIETHEHLQS